MLRPLALDRAARSSHSAPLTWKFAILRLALTFASLPRAWGPWFPFLLYRSLENLALAFQTTRPGIWKRHTIARVRAKAREIPKQNHASGPGVQMESTFLWFVYDTLAESGVCKSMKTLVGPPRFELGTSCTPSKRASQAAPRPDHLKRV